MHNTHNQLNELAEAHLATISDVEELTGQFLKNANQSFLDTRPQILSPIPVAFSETPETLWTALSEYEKQVKHAPPFAVGLSLNGPPDKKKEVQALAGEVQDFQASHPELPISYFTKHYQSGEFTIGKARRQLIGGFVGSCLQLDRYFITPDTAIALNDIDLVKLSADYLPGLWRTLLGGASLAQGSLRHERSQGQYPNMDRVLFWHDLSSVVNPYRKQPNGNAIRLKDYFDVDGFNETHYIGEDSNLHERIQELPNDNPKVQRAAAAHAIVSSRREYDCLQRGVPPHQVWNDGVFSPLDSYRTTPAKLQDISVEAADAMIAEATEQKGYYGSGRTRYDNLEWLLMCSYTGTTERIAADDWVATPAQAEGLLRARAYIQKVKHVGETIVGRAILTS